MGRSRRRPPASLGRDAGRRTRKRRRARARSAALAAEPRRAPARKKRNRALPPMRGLRSHSTCVSMKSAIASRRTSSASVSPACTRPRWRSGSAIASLRGSAPTIGTPIASIASTTSRRWRSLPTRLTMTPPTFSRSSYDPQPLTIAAADCAWPDTSMTSRIGMPSAAATSAEAPVRPGSPGMPSNSPIEASHRASALCPAARAASAARRLGPIAQELRLTPSRPDAAAWNAGSI